MSGDGRKPARLVRSRSGSFGCSWHRWLREWLRAMPARGAEGEVLVARQWVGRCPLAVTNQSPVRNSAPSRNLGRP